MEEQECGEGLMKLTKSKHWQCAWIFLRHWIVSCNVFLCEELEHYGCCFGFGHLIPRKQETAISRKW